MKEYAKLVHFKLSEEEDDDYSDDYDENINKPNHVSSCSCPKCKKYFRFRIQLKNVLKYSQTSVQVLNTIMKLNSIKPCHIKHRAELNLIWLSSVRNISIFSQLRRYQKINHFPKAHLITKKDELYRNFIKMRQLFGAKHFDYIPQTYILPQDRETFTKDYYLSKTNSSTIPDNWIVKPCNKACGKGIRILPSLHALDLNIKSDSNIVVSKYIDNPLLIDSKKFDIRIYVLVTSIEPLKIYLYNDCLIRIASEPFTKNKELLSNDFIHLTNTFVQKKHMSYRKNNNHPNEFFKNSENLPNKLSLKQLQNLITSKLIDLDIDLTKVFVDIEDIAIKTIQSMELQVKATLNKLYKKGLKKNNCFQLFGFDFLLEKRKGEIKVWLIEVNGSPSLGIHSTLDKTLKSSMLCEMLNIVGIHDIDFEKYDIEKQMGYHQQLKRKSTLLRPEFVTDCDMNSESAREHEFQRRSKIKQKLKQSILGEQKRAKNWKLIFPTNQSEKYHNFFEVLSEVQQLVFEIYRNPNM